MRLYAVHDKFTGRGLGLSAVLGIVRGHGGAISGTSQVGRGTSFKLLFPLTHGQTSTDATAPDRRLYQAPPGSTVLVVDDEPSVRESSAAILERLGFSVLTAEDGAQALACVAQHGPNLKLVVMDLTMPNMDGARAFTEIRKAYPKLSVVLMSGHDEQEAASRLAGAGLDGFLQKPFTASALADKAKAALEPRPEETS